MRQVMVCHATIRSVSELAPSITLYPLITFCFFAVKHCRDAVENVLARSVSTYSITILFHCATVVFYFLFLYCIVVFVVFSCFSFLLPFLPFSLSHTPLLLII